MKISRIIPFLCISLSGCSYALLLPSNPTITPLSPTNTATALMTPTSTNTITPTLPTLTFTYTPTFIYLGPSPTIIPTDNITGTPGSIFSPTPTFTETPPVITIPQNSLFKTINLSGDHLFWGACEPSSVNITTHIDNLSNIHIVTVWLRLQDKQNGDTTKWSGGAIMNKEGQGNFSYTLTAKSFDRYQDFLNAWGQFQLVASDTVLQRIAGSSQYLNNLTVAKCP
ncbi:MAG: hypothetical protein ACHQYP_12660 [Nitrospiria bacterium]